MSKTLVDYMNETDFNRFNELIAMASEAKANRPKTVKTRGPLTTEQKIARMEAAIEKKKAALDALLAAEQGE